MLFRHPSRWSRKNFGCRCRSLIGVVFFGGASLLVILWPQPVHAVVLWSELESVLVQTNGAGTDLLGGAVKRDDASADSLYFKFQVDPLSDETTEPYFAALELFEGDTERLSIGNAWDAWGYSAFFNTEGMSVTNSAGPYMDLRSARPSNPAGGSGSYELPRRGVPVTILFKIQYVPGGDDLVTVWLNPDLGPGANEAQQSDSLSRRFNANASFDELRLRHGGQGGGWIFSDLAIATAFNDFADTSGARLVRDESEFVRSGRSLHFRSWSSESGLPDSPLRALAQTADGYLWLAGHDSLARFDGLRFTPVKLSLATNAGFKIILGDRHGGLWLGTDGAGLIHLANGQITSLTTNENLPSNVITALAEDNAGRVWIGTANGLARWQQGKVIPLPSKNSDGGAVVALAADAADRMWVGVKDRGLFHADGEKMSSVVTGEPADIRAAFADRIGRLWLVTGGNTVLCRSQKNWQTIRLPARPGRTENFVFAEEADGTIWLLAGGNLFQFADGKFSLVPAESQLAGNTLSALFADRQGKIWAATDEALNLLQRKSLFFLGQNEGLGFGPIQGLAQVSPGVVWAARSGDGIYRWDGRGFSRLKAAGLSAHNLRANALLVARDATCWVATSGGLLRYKDPIAAADEAGWFELPGSDILSLAETADGSLLAGTREGKLWRLEQGVWRQENFPAMTNAILAINTETDGGIWLGTDGRGLIHLSNDTANFFGKTSGLPSETIRAIFRDSRQTLWLGTAGGGLVRWDSGRAGPIISTGAGLPGETVSQILEDAGGRLWLGTSRGIAGVSRQQLDEFAAGKIAAVAPRMFDHASGMEAEDCTGGYCPAGLRTASGLLWFATGKGVAVIAPQTLPPESPPPPAIVEEVLVDGVPLAAGKAASPIHIPPGRHRLEFHFTGLDFEAPEEMRFRYRLVGWDADWVSVGNTRSAVYNFVPPGEYTFQVAARNRAGLWTAEGASLKLILERHFWQSGWFLGLTGMALLVLVGGTVRFVERQKAKARLKRVEQERVLEQERTRIARDLHDEMGAKLCRISFLSEHARRDGAPATEIREQIKSISDDSREVLHSLDEIVWAVNPQNDTLEHAVSYLAQYAQEYFAMTGVECELVVPAQVPPYPVSSQVRHHLFLAVREALANILKHSGATRARITMSVTPAGFEILVADNGTGFAVAQKADAHADAEGTHDGLRNMVKRFADAGGRCRIESAPGAGTTVNFLLPLKPSTSHPS